MVAIQLTTIEEFAAIDNDRLKRELLDGEVIELSPAGTKHILIVSTLVRKLNRYADSHDGVHVLVGDGGFIFARNPDTLLEPDISIASAEQLRVLANATETFARLAPKIVIEVKSPNDREAQIARKLSIYLSAGVEEVWWVRPERYEVTINRPDAAPEHVSRGESLSTALLPGFVVEVSELFEGTE